MNSLAGACGVALVVLAVCPATAGSLQSTETLTARELAAYRLTAAAFDRFEAASRAIAAILRDDPAFAQAPLFTREIVSAADAEAAAATLEARLQSHPALAAALRTTKISARDYTTFALALFAARLAHGFVESGVLRRVPGGVAADNVAFVDAHEQRITTLLDELGIEG